MKQLIRSSIVLTLLGTALAGCCCTAPGPYHALDYHGELENSETLVLLDGALQRMISVEGQRAGYTSDGRLIAEANIRNILEQSIEIQLQTVFRDSQGMSSGDESAWTTLIIQPLATETYSCTALNDKSTQFTTRVRLPK